MKKIVLLVCIILLGGMAYAHAQKEVVRNGNNFIEISKKAEKQEVVKTQYTYTASDGNVYPIYLSSTHKAFIIRKSSRTGKEYRQYLPEVTKQLQQK